MLRPLVAPEWRFAGARCGSVRYGCSRRARGPRFGWCVLLLATFALASRAAPTHAESEARAAYNAGLAAEARTQLAEAERLYLRAYQLSPRGATLLSLARVRLRAGHIDDARAAVTAARRHYGARLSVAEMKALRDLEQQLLAPEVAGTETAQGAEPGAAARDTGAHAVPAVYAGAAHPPRQTPSTATHAAMGRPEERKGDRPGVLASRRFWALSTVLAVVLVGVGVGLAANAPLAAPTR